MSISREISPQIFALINEGKSRCSVALPYNLVHSTVNHIYRWYIVTRSFMHRLWFGHPRTTDKREIRNIMRIMIWNPYLISNIISGTVNFYGHTRVSSQFVANFANVAYTTVNQHKPQYSLWNTNDVNCLSLAVVWKGLESGFLHVWVQIFSHRSRWLSTYTECSIYSGNLGTVHTTQYQQHTSDVLVVWWWCCGNSSWSSWHGSEVSGTFYLLCICCLYEHRTVVLCAEQLTFIIEWCFPSNQSLIGLRWTFSSLPCLARAALNALSIIFAHPGLWSKRMVLHQRCSTMCPKTFWNEPPYVNMKEGDISKIYCKVYEQFYNISFVIVVCVSVLHRGFQNKWNTLYGDTVINIIKNIMLFRGLTNFIGSSQLKFSVTSKKICRN